MTPIPTLAAAGAFVVSLDSMMNIAFPAIAAAFAASSYIAGRRALAARRRKP